MAKGAFWILHFEKANTQAIPDVDFWPGVFCLDTCQRRIWIFTNQDQSILRGSVGENSFGDHSFDGQVLENEAAYSKLLRILTGLESRVIGETDVFGQFKTSWTAFQAQFAENVSSYQGLIQNLCEDTKEIRAKCIQNIGGNSYGTLVRKALREKGMKAGDSVLIVGAGQMAESVAPYLQEQKLSVLNRSVRRTQTFLTYVNSKRKTPATLIEFQQMTEFDFIVMAIPEFSELEADIVKCLKPNAVVIHLGTCKESKGFFNLTQTVLNLSELFGSQDDLGALRERKIDLARKACAERAIHRGLGAHLSVPHGWEYLALFG